MTLRSLFVILTACTYVCVDAQSQDLLEEAHLAYEQFTAISQSVQDALAQGDQAAAAERNARAEEMLERARELFEQGRAEDSQDSALLEEYGDVLFLAEETDLATTIYRLASERDTENLSARLKWGRSLVILGTEFATTARKTLESCLIADEGTVVFASAHFELGNLYRNSGLFDLALEHYEKTKKLASTHVPTKIAIATLKIRTGFVTEGAALLDELGAISGEHAPLLQKYLTEALVDFDRARLWFEDTAGNHRAFGKLNLRAGRLSQSIAPLERAITLDESDYISLNLLGSVYNQSGDAANARKAFEKSLEINPDQDRTREILKQMAAADVPQ